MANIEFKEFLDNYKYLPKTTFNLDPCPAQLDSQYIQLIEFAIRNGINPIIFYEKFYEEIVGKSILPVHQPFPEKFYLSFPFDCFWVERFQGFLLSEKHDQAPFLNETIEVLGVLGCKLPDGFFQVVYCDWDVDISPQVEGMKVGETRKVINPYTKGEVEYTLDFPAPPSTGGSTTYGSTYFLACHLDDDLKRLEENLNDTSMNQQFELSTLRMACAISLIDPEVIKMGSAQHRHRMRVGTGKTRQLVKMNDIVHIKMKREVTPTKTDTYTPIDWSYSARVMGHWRKYGGIGKSPQDDRVVIGKTWVKPHTRGKGPIVNKLRLTNKF